MPAAVGSTITSITACCEYIFLDKEERNLVAKNKHEYLIEQLHSTPKEEIAANTLKKDINLNFKHPVKELIFVLNQKNKTTSNTKTGNDWFNYAYNTTSNNIVSKSDLIESITSPDGSCPISIGSGCLKLPEPPCLK